MAKQVCPNCDNECGIVFRWFFKHPVTGQVIRATKRPFPIPVCNCHKGL